MLSRIGRGEGRTVSALRLEVEVEVEVETATALGLLAAAHLGSTSGRVLGVVVVVGEGARLRGYGVDEAVAVMILLG